MLDEDAPSFLPSRREALAGAVLAAALPAASPASGAGLPDDGGDFVLIDGWMLRRDDLAR